MGTIRILVGTRKGAFILTSDGQPDRRAIAEIVFPAPDAPQSVQDQAQDELQFLERLTHPEIGNEILSRLRESVSDYGEVETAPRLEGRQMTMVSRRKGMDSPA